MNTDPYIIEEYKSDYRLSDSLIARRIARDKRDGRRYATHENGQCGYMGSLCGQCHKDEYLEMLKWAQAQPAPLPGERAVEYWERIHGAFYDAWHDAACARIAELKGRN